MVSLVAALVSLVAALVSLVAALVSLVAALFSDTSAAAADAAAEVALAEAEEALVVAEVALVAAEFAETPALVAAVCASSTSPVRELAKVVITLPSPELKSPPREPSSVAPVVSVVSGLAGVAIRLTLLHYNSFECYRQMLPVYYLHHLTHLFLEQT